MSKNMVSRRTFLAGTIAAAAGCRIVPRHILGGKGYTPPSEKLNIAGIGVGGRGEADLGGVRTENIVALCDVDEEQAANSFRRWPNAKKYKDFRVMLDKEKGIDAVVIATPDHIHAVAAMAAMQIGKHVYVEKPLAHSIYEARMLADAAKRYNVTTQMGNQGHAADGVRKACEIVWSGEIGGVHTVYAWTDRSSRPASPHRPADTPPVPETLDWNLWLGPAAYRPYHPAYLPHRWRYWWDFGCGSLGDMGCHILDPPFWALKLGAPTSVEPVEILEGSEETAPRASVIRYEFPRRRDMCPVTLFWYDAGKLPPRPAGIGANVELGDGGNGSLFIGDKGILTTGCYGIGTRLLPDSKMDGYRFPHEAIPRTECTIHEDWVRACKRNERACSDFGYAAALTEMILLGNVALRAREKIYWDADDMKVTNVPEADKYIRREYRPGWSL